MSSKGGHAYLAVRISPALAIHFDPLMSKSRQPLKEKSTIFNGMRFDAFSSVAALSLPFCFLDKVQVPGDQSDSPYVHSSHL